MNTPTETMTFRGARALEEALLQALALEHEATAQNPRLLSEPVRVVVPSAALRRHLIAELAAQLGGTLGIEIETVSRAAERVLENCGEWALGGGELFDLLARRSVEDQPELKAQIEAFHDGAGLVVGSIRDLVSAGLEDEILAPALESLDDCSHEAERLRARSCAEAAVKAQVLMHSVHAERRSTLMKRAAEALRTQPAALPARRVFIHGFADAPGATTEFLRALRMAKQATVTIDRPADPAFPDQPSSGMAYLDRFLLRLGIDPSGLSANNHQSASATHAPRISAHAAYSAQDEAHAVAQRVKSLLQAGTAPEEITIVSRNIEAATPHFIRAFEDYGLPLSGGRLSLGAWPEERQADAILELLDVGPKARIERWLAAGFDDALAHPASLAGSSLRDLRLGLRVLGLSTVKDLLGEDALNGLGPRQWVSLPVRQSAMPEGSSPGAESHVDYVEDAQVKGPENLPLRSHRRRCPVSLIKAAQALAQGFFQWHQGWRSAPLSLADHASQLRALPGLGSKEPSAPRIQPSWIEVIGLLEDLHRPGLSTTATEATRLIRQLWVVKKPPDAGRGGVALMDAARARGLSFGHLMMVGMERNVFPRRVEEDPFLRDSARAALGAVIEDLALIHHGHDEEHYLFAQLVGGAQNLWLSWRTANEDGKSVQPSLLVHPWADAEASQDEHGGRPADQKPEPKPAPALPSHAALALGVLGAASESPDYAAVFATAWHDLRSRPRLQHAHRAGSMQEPSASDQSSLSHIHELATQRLSILREIEPNRSTATGRKRLAKPSLYLGQLGTGAKTVPAWNEKLFVTTLESIARCPWQTFLKQGLGLEPTPDPLSAPPTLSALLVGNVVHHCLEALVLDATQLRPSKLSELQQQSATPMPRPSSQAIAKALKRVCKELSEGEGLYLPGLHLALAARARPLIDKAIDADWPDDEVVFVRGVEVEGFVAMSAPAEGLRIHFRADRVDGEGAAMRLTDYKTGKKGWSSAKGRGGAESAFARRQRSGVVLQGTIYAMAAPEGSGRYLFLGGPAHSPAEAQEVALDQDVPEGLEESTLLPLLGALELGVLFPRLANLKSASGPACNYCELKTACSQGDTQAKLWIERLATDESGGGSAQDSTPWTHVLKSLWPLGQ